MALTIVTAPTIEPVTPTEIRGHLRIDAAGEDDQIVSWIAEARRYCENFQNRSYNNQTWDLTMDDFPAGDIMTIPLPPLQSVSSITYYGIGNTASTMTAGRYFVDTASEPGRVSLAYNEIWPTATLRPVNGVVVRFVAGYGSTNTSVTDNKSIRQAIMLLVGHWFEHRENTDIKELHDIPDGVDAILMQERIFPL